MNPNILGQAGVQFFVDAGIPVNDKIVNDLIEQVIVDEINNMAAGQRTADDQERRPVVPPVERQQKPGHLVAEVDNAKRVELGQVSVSFFK